MKRLSPLDAAWLYVESRDTPMHVGCLQIFRLPAKAPPDFVRTLVENLRALRTYAPPFSLKLKTPRFATLSPAWIEDPELDLDYHLRHSALPQPGGERELGMLISRLHSHPLDLHRPLWECHVIEGLEDGRFAMFSKIHHALVDGVAGMRLMQGWLSPQRRVRKLTAPWAPRPRKGHKPPAPHEGGGLNTMLHQLLGQVRTVPGVYGSLSQIVRTALGRAPTSDLTAPYGGPQSVLNGRISAQRRFATQQYELERVRRVAKAAGVTVNDVFLGICSGALRRYLKEIGALPGKSLTAGVPVSVRAHDNVEIGTAISFVMATLASDIGNPRRRLAAIHASTRAAKEHLRGLSRAEINPYTLLLMAPYILTQLTGLGGRGRPVFNIAISNVPGPEAPLYFNGARMEALYPASVLTHGQALNITAVSYAGTLDIGYTACRVCLPSVQRIAVYTGEALEEMESLFKQAPPAA